eukprot:COSAG02_NODE_14627_length_1253_cov_1.450607_1_plen_106_part_10
MFRPHALANAERADTNPGVQGELIAALRAIVIADSEGGTSAPAPAEGDLANQVGSPERGQSISGHVALGAHPHPRALWKTVKCDTLLIHQSFDCTQSINVQCFHTR